MKKKYIILIVLMSVPAFINAQNEIDALRYSQLFSGGTTRSASMAGAFGALGGDFSSLSINPAGIGVFRSSEFTISPTLLYDNARATYLGSAYEDSKYHFLLNNMGFVTTHKTGKDNGFVSVTFGFGYNRLNDFNKNTLIQGRQTKVAGPVSPLAPPIGIAQSSYLDNFTNNANNNDWSDFYEELAWNANLMPYDTLAGEYWNDLSQNGYGQLQQQRIVETGGIGEYAFSVGGNYEEKLFMGATFGIHSLRYSRLIDHYEVDDNQVVDYFDSFRFRENLETFGTGYTFKVGMIYRPISLIRFGAAFHIPTFYKVREEFYTTMEGNFDPETGEVSTDERAPLNTFDYWLRTPFRAIGSVAIQLPKLATFNIDYELVDYSMANLDSRDYPFIDENQVIRGIYKPASNIRAGAEFRLGTIYLRGGAGYYGSPFVSSEVNSDAHTLLFAGGVGFRSKNIFFDVGYSKRINNMVYYMYPEEVFGADLENSQSMFMSTLGIRF